jgi:hypothetical protein
MAAPGKPKIAEFCLPDFALFSLCLSKTGKLKRVVLLQEAFLMANWVSE